VVQERVLLPTRQLILMQVKHIVSYNFLPKDKPSSLKCVEDIKN
jgi:hypothetical protein